MTIGLGLPPELPSFFFFYPTLNKSLPHRTADHFVKPAALPAAVQSFTPTEGDLSSS